MSFPHETLQSLKTFVNVCHGKIQNFLNLISIFSSFTIHADIIWAQTEIGTFQHFCHECKWHAHIGDVFSNILISYMHFPELVWICYEIFKVTVKRSTGKSIRGANELGQKRGLFEFRGKTHGYDTTRGSNVIVPFMKGFETSNVFEDRKVKQ